MTDPQSAAVEALLQQVGFVLTVTGPMTPQQQEVWPELQWRYEAARAALAAVDAEPHASDMRSRTDRFFVADKSGRSIHDDDFKYDAMLRIDGDFADDATRASYAEWLCSKLNAVDAEPKAQPAETVAWLFNAKRPGRRSEWASISNVGDECWPLDEWREVKRAPLVIGGDAEVIYTGTGEPYRGPRGFAEADAKPAPVSVSSIDIERMIAECIPGGDICDPQAVADAIRRYCDAWPAGDAEPAQLDLPVAYLRSIRHPDWLDTCGKDAPGAFPVYAKPQLCLKLNAVDAEPVQEPVAGWKLVPVEPTPEMLAAADHGDMEYTRRNFGDIQRVMQGPYDHWCAMLAASPTNPAEPQPAAGTLDENLRLRALIAGRERLLRMVLDDLDVCAGESGADWQPTDLSTETVEAFEAYRRDAHPAEPQRVPLKLTVAEIIDLASFAGIPTSLRQMDVNELEAEIVITDCPPQGVKDDDGIESRHYAHVAYMADYPEEGCYPLGPEVPASHGIAPSPTKETT